MTLPQARQSFVGVTASMAAAAIGVHPYQSRAQAWRIATGREAFERNSAMEWGTYYEVFAVAQYEAEMGEICTDTGEAQRFVVSSRYPWLGCTPDGFPMGGGLIECKCPQSMYSEPQAYHVPQMQVAMAVTGRSWDDYVVWTPDAFAVWRCYWDEAYWEWMLPYLYAFWRCIRDDRQPPRFKRGRKPTQPKVCIERIV